MDIPAGGDARRLDGTYGAPGWIWLAGVATAVAATAAVGGLMLGARGHTVRTTYAPGAAFVLLGCLTVGGYAVAAPSVAEAEKAFADGDIQHARTTIDALVRRGTDVGDAEAVLDGIELRGVANAPNVATAVQRYRAYRWHTKKAKLAAKGHVRANAKLAIAAARKRSDARGLLGLAQALSGDWQSESNRARAEAVLVNVDTRVLNRDFRRAWEELQGVKLPVLQSDRAAREKTLKVAVDKQRRVALSKMHQGTTEARHVATTRAVELTKLQGTITGKTDEALIKRLTKQQTVLAGVLAKRKTAEARRAAAREAAEERRKAIAKRRAAAVQRRANRSSRSLLCRDGTLSPTCTCGGSRRGCCSHHGGVAGCAD